jgi:flavin-dependent dehydrogenase
VRIAGAGVAGLTSAIALARRGIGVEIFERRPAAWAARPPRFDAVENWTTADDFGVVLSRWSIDASPFRPIASIEVHTFDGATHVVRQDRPVLYLAKRGNEPGCLEHSLERQALALGVRIHRGRTLTADQADVWATGVPRCGVFLDVALTFRTSSPDRVEAIVDRRITPKAYAYLIVVDGAGTLAILLTDEFGRARSLLGRAVATFQRLRPFDMREPRLQSGFGGAPHAFAARARGARVIGEAAGFLDYLWGFGIRHAMLSGTLAARSIVEGVDYETLVAREVRPLVATSLVNRRFYDYAGNHAYRLLIRYFCGRADLRASLQRFYRARRVRSMFVPWIVRSLAKQP